MDEGWVALLVLGALAAGIVVGQRVRAGRPRTRVTPSAPPAAEPAQNDTYSHTVDPAIAAKCGCN
jgi:hypothetical protein